MANEKYSDTFVDGGEIKTSGTTQWYVSTEEAHKAIKNFEFKTGTKFIKLFRHKYDSFKSRIRWEANTNIPYIITGSGKLECQFGKDRDKERKEQRKKQSLKNILQGLEPHRKRALCSRRCKKMNCEAVISIMEVLKFPQFEIDDVSKSKRTMASKRLRELLQEDGGSAIQEYGCCVTFPSNDSHSGHAVNEAASVVPLHESLAGAIDELVTQGVTTVKEIKKHLRTYVQDVLFKNEEPPAVTDRRFYPTAKDIRHYWSQSYIDVSLDDRVKEDQSEMWVGEINNLLLEIEAALGGVQSEGELWKTKDALRDILVTLSKSKHKPFPFKLENSLPVSMKRKFQDSVFDHLSCKRLKGNQCPQPPISQVEIS